MALDAPALTRAVDVMRDHLGTDLSVGDLADAAGYSPAHFARRFAETTGLSPGRFLTAVRLNAAKHLLLDHSDAVIDIATEVGFSSLSSFSRRFHALVGTAPHRFRLLGRQVSDFAIPPFTISDSRQSSVTISITAPPDQPTSSQLWVGWYPWPAPVGLPTAGLLADLDRTEFQLPLCPGSPWLMAFLAPGAGAVSELLAPVRPLVAAHPAPITMSATVTLDFFTAGHTSVPLLSALPALSSR